MLGLKDQFGILADDMVVPCCPDSDSMTVLPSLMRYEIKAGKLIIGDGHFSAFYIQYEYL